MGYIISFRSANLVLQKYSKQIFAFCEKSFGFLCKNIIQAYAWVQKKGIKVINTDQSVRFSFYLNCTNSHCIARLHINLDARERYWLNLSC